jgi:hypothetical protein
LAPRRRLLPHLEPGTLDLLGDELGHHLPRLVAGVPLGQHAQVRPAADQGEGDGGDQGVARRHARDYTARNKTGT